MIQLNLLPDVKIAFIKARAQKRLVTMGSIIVSAVTLAIFLLLFVYVHVTQATYSKDLSTDIADNAKQLQGTKDLNKILTVQNQLRSLDGVHNLKPASNRLTAYIAKTTPSSVVLTDYEVDFTAKTVKVNGVASTLDAVNTYINTLKTTRYIAKDPTTQETTTKKAFNDVVLTFTRDEKEATFGVAFSYDEIIFNSEYEVTLQIPQNQAENNNAFGQGQ